MLRNIAFFTVLFAVFSGAVSMNLETDSASIYGTHGSVFVWLVNDGSAKNVSLSAYTGELTAYFEDAFIALVANGAKGTKLHFSAPDCASGVQDIEVHALVSDASGEEILSKNMRVFVYPARSCDYTLQLNASQDAYISAPATGDGSLVRSNLVFSSYFDPTNYAISLSASSACKQVKQGEFMKQKVFVSNRGAAGTFELRLVGPYADTLNAGLSKSTVSLGRGESEIVFIDATPSRSAHGTHYLSVQALYNGVAIAQQDVCIQVEDFHSAFMLLPKSLSGAKTCEPVFFEGVFYNNGTADDVYSISSSQGMVDVADFSLNAGASVSFRVSIMPDKLKSGTNLISVSATSAGRSRIAGSGVVLIDASECVAPAAEASVSQSEAKDNLVKLVVAVQNDFDYDLQNVTAAVAGIPSAWEVSSEQGVTVPAKSTRDIIVWVKQTTDDEASAPVVIVKSNGKDVATQNLQTIPARASGITGFVMVALSQNSWLIAALVLIALAVVILTGRRKTEEEKYREKLDVLKKKQFEEMS